MQCTGREIKDYLESEGDPQGWRSNYVLKARDELVFKTACVRADFITVLVGDDTLYDPDQLGYVVILYGSDDDGRATPSFTVETIQLSHAIHRWRSVADKDYLTLRFKRSLGPKILEFCREHGISVEKPKLPREDRR